MQQYNAGLSLDKILTDNEEFNQSLKALISATQNIWTSSDIITKQAEYQLNYSIEQFIFTAVYDLIILYPKKAVIFDWKTFTKPDNQKLINDWQTKLYLYILAEKLNYKPHQIEFTYWFIKLPNKPESFTIKYNKPNHDRTKQELKYLLGKLENLTNEYIENNQDFPHHNNCDNCDYQYLFTEELNKLNIDRNIPTSLDEI
jgi:CRISPR/Cas system-associated exonuclease Cas4 (RecB family)